MDRLHYFSGLVCAFLLSAIPVAYAAPPPTLPGDDITIEYARQRIPVDTTKKTSLAASAEPANWISIAQNTWDAPELDKQLARNDALIPVGKGALFVPRMGKAELEPESDILDSSGNDIATIRSGSQLALLPGKYFVMLGSGSHQQRMVRQVTVLESKVSTLTPDWAALSIEVVDENALPFRGLYEITRIDEFEAYGRGVGGDPALGEEIKTWVLKPGIYKIFGVGESYNTQKNFVTVRLLPGEMTRFQLVMNNDAEQKITGGGIAVSRLDMALTSNWRYGFDLGGSILLNATTNHGQGTKDTTDFVSSLEMIGGAQVAYRVDPIDWKSSLKIDERLTIRSFDLAQTVIAFDQSRLTSLFTYRFLPWLGPYGRSEITTTLFPKYATAPEDDSTGRHYLIMLRSDSTISSIDSGRTTALLQPAFSPFRFEAGIGANVSLFSFRYVEARILGGFGFAQETGGSQAEISDTAHLVGSTVDSAYQNLLNEKMPVIRVRSVKKILSKPEYGPEAALSATVRIGALATAETECKLLLPIERINKPDLEWTNTISWRMIRGVTLDYVYSYLLKQPENIDARKNQSQHSVRLRFSYGSR